MRGQSLLENLQVAFETCVLKSGEGEEVEEKLSKGVLAKRSSAIYANQTRRMAAAFPGKKSHSMTIEIDASVVFG